MEWTVENPPTWLTGLPEYVVRMGLGLYHALKSATGMDDAAAMTAVVQAIAGRWRQNGDQWEELPGREKKRTLQFRAAIPQAGGQVWEVVLIAPGLSLGRPQFFWDEAVLEAGAALFEGLDVCAYEMTADYLSHLQVPGPGDVEDVKRYLTAKKVGYVRNVKYAPGVGLMAEIVFISDAIPKMLQDGKMHGNPDVLGLSIDARVKGLEILVDGNPVNWVLSIKSVSSVDCVTRPAAGGKFLRAVAGLNKTQGDIMDKEKILQMIRAAQPGLLAGRDTSAMSIEDVEALARMAMTPPPAATPKAEPPAQTITLDQITARIGEAVGAVEQRALCARRLDTALSGSELPAHAAARVREQFDGRVFETAALETAIKTEKEYIARLSAPAEDFGLDSQDRRQVHIVGIGTRERAQMALDKLFKIDRKKVEILADVKRLDNRPFFDEFPARQAISEYDQVPAFSSLREAYAFFTGDPEVSGKFNRRGLPADLRAALDINSSTFTYALANTLNRRLVADYRALDFGENMLISFKKPVKDFRTQEAVNMGYFPDLATVDPEAADYDEIDAITDEEATYALLQKGNILTISRKTIINDDVSLVERVIRRLPRAARRTHAKYVWDKFISNANCSDGTAWFSGPHGNLGATALSIATALIAYKWLGKTTEKDSGEIIGLLSDPDIKPVLVYPIDLIEEAETVVLDEYYYATNDLTDKKKNPLYGKIAGKQVSLFTDVNDWGLLMPPNVVDMIEMGYLNGREEPEMFVADAPQAEQVFVADKIRHKIRHEYAGAVIDYRSGYKAVVA